MKTYDKVIELTSRIAHDRHDFPTDAELTRLEQICQCVDEFAEEFKVDSVDVAYNNAENRITVKMLCPSIRITPDHHRAFHDLVWQTGHIRFIPIDAQNIRIELDI